jgi:hypothetical protein
MGRGTQPVLGGAVQGVRCCGTAPVIANNGPDDAPYYNCRFDHWSGSMSSQSDEGTGIALGAGVGVIVLVLGLVFGVVKFCFAPAKAELAKERAFTAKELPTSSGVPDGQIVMVRPNDIKAGATSAADGRRVEVFLL